MLEAKNVHCVPKISVMLYLYVKKKMVAHFWRCLPISYPHLFCHDLFMVCFTCKVFGATWKELWCFFSQSGSACLWWRRSCQSNSGAKQLLGNLLKGTVLIGCQTLLLCCCLFKGEMPQFEILPKLLLLCEPCDELAVVSEAISLASSKMVTHIFFSITGFSWCRK